MAARSPHELGFTPPAPPDLIPGRGEAAVLWDPDSRFDLYLRRVRTEAGWTVRQAAARFGFAYSYLARLETTPRSRAPNLSLVQQVAEVYRRDFREVLAEAGYRFETSPEVDFREDVDRMFERLVGYPGLRPYALPPEATDYYGRRQKNQLIDFAVKLERHLQSGGPSVVDILRGSASPPEGDRLVSPRDTSRDDE